MILKTGRVGDKAVLVTCRDDQTVAAHVAFTAEQLDGLIRNLAALRATMTPAVPAVATGPLTAIVNPSFGTWIEPLSEMTTLCFRHPGLGLQTYLLPEPAVAKLIECLVVQKAAPRRPKGPAN